jgi:hypothetical protein
MIQHCYIAYGHDMQIIISSNCRRIFAEIEAAQQRSYIETNKAQMYTNPHISNILEASSKRWFNVYLTTTTLHDSRRGSFAIHVDKMHAILMLYAIKIMPFLLGISRLYARIESDILRRYCAFVLLTHSLTVPSPLDILLSFLWIRNISSSAPIVPNCRK